MTRKRNIVIQKFVKEVWGKLFHHLRPVLSISKREPRNIKENWVRQQNCSKRWNSKKSCYLDWSWTTNPVISHLFMGVINVYDDTPGRIRFSPSLNVRLWEQQCCRVPNFKPFCPLLRQHMLPQSWLLLTFDILFFRLSSFHFYPLDIWRKVIVHKFSIDA